MPVTLCKVSLKANITLLLIAITRGWKPMVSLENRPENFFKNIIKSYTFQNK
jgi:hypothetical protein